MLTRLVGRNIYNKRKRLGLTQEELAERIGIGQQSLSRMEKGRIAPKFERLQIIADTLECPVTDLFREDDGDTSALVERIADMLQGLDARRRELVFSHVEGLVKILKEEGGKAR
jgi:transcriptional regulator with XRE-family HTH domain